MAGQPVCKLAQSASSFNTGPRRAHGPAFPTGYPQEQQGMKRTISAALAALALMAPLAVGAHPNHEPASGREMLGETIREYLLENPEVIEEALDILRARQQAEERKRTEAAIRENGEALRAHPLSPVSGNPAGARHRGRVLRLPVRLLQARAAGNGGAARDRCECARGLEGIPDPRPRLRLCGPRRDGRSAPGQVSALPPRAAEGAQAHRGEGAGARCGGRTRH